jgi:subtilisin family serine protease
MAFAAVGVTAASTTAPVVNGDDAAATACPLGVGVPVFHQSQVLVRFRPEVEAGQLDALIAKGGGRAIVQSYSLVPNLFCISVDAGTVQEAIAAFGAMPEVMYAEPDHIRFAQAQTTPYGITMVNAPTVWPMSPTSRGQGVRVAVLDTGVDLTHPDLPVPVLTQSFVPGQTVDDLHTHGTHTSGTVLALDNTIGVVGVAPGASLMTGKVLGNGGSGADSWVMAGVNWGVDNGAKVVSMSLGGAGYAQASADIMAAARAANVLVLASAGNNNSDVPSYPASYPGCMSIAAVDSAGARAGFSNFGQFVSVTAPGVSVQSTIPIIAATATWDGTPRNGSALTGSATGSATGQAIFCSFGSLPTDFPANVAGNIAHVRRGSPDANAVTFQTKVQNALAAGAVGVIVSNNVAGGFSGTLNMNVNIPVVGITQTDGDTLQGASGVSTTVFVGQTGHGYANFSGTSMSCPHVAGVAALMIGSTGGRPATADQLEMAIENSATDLGDTGWDPYFGHGLVNAPAAVAYLNSLLTPTCGSSDYNGDGDFGTDQDIEAFFACLAGQCCATCFPGGADFNGDGDTGTDQDIEAFFRVLAGGNC